MLVIALCMTVLSCSKSSPNASISGGGSQYYCFCSWEPAPTKVDPERFYYPAGTTMATAKGDCETTKTVWAQSQGVSGGVCELY